ncbi:MAG: SDR family oxidoreductase [Pseudomonadota bacterium]
MGQVSYGLEGKTALITGGSRGIGLEIARELLNEKARVVVCARKKDGLDAAVAALGNNPDLRVFQAHVGKDEDVDALFNQVKAWFGGLDILVNNVGMNLFTPGLAETDPGLWRKIVDSNLNGTFLCSRRAAALMKEQKSGKIVTITSTAARRAAPGMGVYGVAKAAMEMMTKVLAAELAPFNIQVNAVAPGMVKTDFSKPFWSNPEIHDHVVKSIPAGRLAESRDVVHPVLFLASAGAGYITGQILGVDGGATAV